MNESIVTSKGTVTIPAYYRKRMGIEPSRRVKFSMNSNDELVLSPAITIEEFAKKRDALLSKVEIPKHLVGLSGDDLREAAAKAWNNSER